VPLGPGQCTQYLMVVLVESEDEDVLAHMRSRSQGRQAPAPFLHVRPCVAPYRPTRSVLRHLVGERLLAGPVPVCMVLCCSRAGTRVLRLTHVVAGASPELADRCSALMLRPSRQERPGPQLFPSSCAE